MTKAKMAADDKLIEPALQHLDDMKITKVLIKTSPNAQERLKYLRYLSILGVGL